MRISNDRGDDLTSGLVELCAGKAPDDAVFTSPKGRLLRLTNWRPACSTRPVSTLALWAFRHTICGKGRRRWPSRPVQNVKAVQRMLGRASAAMTLDVYAGLFSDDLDDVADRRTRLCPKRATSGRTVTRRLVERTGKVLTCWYNGGPRWARTDDLRIKRIFRAY